MKKTNTRIITRCERFKSSYKKFELLGALCTVIAGSSSWGGGGLRFHNYENKDSLLFDWRSLLLQYTRLLVYFCVHFDVICVSIIVHTHCQMESIC